jgi:Skp family chaperone for outer membrane proteins
LKQFVSRGDAELEQQTRRMLEDVLKDIRQAAEAKGKAGGYTFVVDNSAESLSKAPIFLYNSGEADLTAAVIDQLNATAPPEPAATEKPAGKK